MEFEIKHRVNGSILFSVEAETLKLAVEAAVKSSANLSGADLRYADLSDANLRSADLSDADLRFVNLRYADLSDANLRSADLSYANLRFVNLRYADLSDANLSYADLRDANLRGANLRYADLSGVNLSYADLSGADLRGANLRDSIGINKNLTTPLRILLEQTGLIRAYKLIKKNGEGPFNGGLNYLTTDTFEVKELNPYENEQCGAGISLATLDWCMKEWKEGYRILVMEFYANDPEGNLVIPTATDGKFRVRKCKRVGEKDLKELGLVK